jgi:hypothetical protein
MPVLRLCHQRTYVVGRAGPAVEELMPLTMRPTGVSSPVDKDREDTIYSGKWPMGRIYELAIQNLYAGFGQYSAFSKSRPMCAPTSRADI